MARRNETPARRILRRLKPSAECFAAAAAIYSPEVMLTLEAARKGR
jgi:hypothetical protein